MSNVRAWWRNGGRLDLTVWVSGVTLIGMILSALVTSARVGSFVTSLDKRVEAVEVWKEDHTHISTSECNEINAKLQAVDDRLRAIEQATFWLVQNHGGNARDIRRVK